MHSPRFRRFFRIDRGAADVEVGVEEELRFHFDMTVRDLMATGMSPEDARREAERRFGDVQRTRESLTSLDRERAGRERRTEWLSGIAQDLRYAARGLRTKPGFTLAVVLTLGLGIGANATMFGIVDQLLFRPPAFLPNPDAVNRVYLLRTFDGKEFPASNMQYLRYQDLTKWSKSFSETAAFWHMKSAVGTGDEARELTVGGVSAGYWRIFGAKPVIGRFFGDDEDRVPEGSPVVVLGYGFWQSKYGGRASALGSRLHVGQSELTIIGVAPKGFVGTASTPPAMFVPITRIASEIDFGQPANRRYFDSYNMSWMEMLVRRKPGVTADVATADLTNAYLRSYAAQRTMAPRTEPAEASKPHALATPVVKERGPRPGQDTKVATWLVGVAAIVLIIACANVGNLLLARALRRRREIAVRLALGISRGRLLAQLLTESVLLAMLGGVAGMAIAQWGGRILRASLLPNIEQTNSFGDPRVLGFTAIATIVAGLLTGIAPAFRAGRSDLAATLKAGAREGTHSRSRLRTALLVMQGALSVVLLVGAGLFVRSLHNVKSVRLGYDVGRVLWVNAEMRGVKLGKPERTQLKNRLLEQARALREVAQASRTVTVPFYMTMEDDIFVAGIDSATKLGDFTQQAGSPEYFETMGTRIVRGRSFTAADRSGAPPVMVVSQSMARTLWKDRDAIGQCVRIGADTMPCTAVIGIAEDIKHGSLGKDDHGLNYYLPIEQKNPAEGGLFVRTRGDAASQTETVRRALQKLMPGVSYVTVTPLDDIVNPEMRPWQLGATMFAVFGGLALLVAAVGLYSVIAYNVAQRMHEMGVRVALGAQTTDVVRIVVQDGMKVAVVAVVLGAGVSLLAGRWIAPLLFETSARDPLVYGAVGSVLIAIALAASFIPGMRAARVDPSVALRAD
ncbi:MAG: ABC transporter permease [Gemmatimonadota bacterium]|nr:ABC transporter permease [Gemmatimonadota bacterium]